MKIKNVLVDFEYYLKTRCKRHAGLPEEAPFGSSQVKSSTRCCAAAVEGRAGACAAAHTLWWWNWSGNPVTLTVVYQRGFCRRRSLLVTCMSSAGSPRPLVEKHQEKGPVGAHINVLVLMGDSLGRTCQHGLSPRGRHKIQDNSWNYCQNSQNALKVPQTVSM